MPLSWFTESATVLRAPLATVNGRTERDWANARAHVVSACSVQPGGTSTDFADPARVERIDATLYAPAGADLEDGDRVEFGGRTYVIDGAPRPWRSPTGRVSNVQASLRAWGG